MLVKGQRPRSAARSARRPERGFRLTGDAVGSEFLSDGPAHDVEGRTAMDIFKQGVVDKGLVVPPSRCVYETPKIFQDGVVQANGDLRLFRLRFNDGTALRAREVDIAVFFSYDLFHRVPSGVCSPSKLKSLGCYPARGVASF